MHVPYLRVGENTSFEMMEDQFFVYDASITALLVGVLFGTTI